MPYIRLAAAATAIFSLLALSSCISTETIESPAPDTSAQEIVIKLEKPDASDTRADSDFRLRYTARIFSGGSLGGWQFITRKDILEGDESGNQIVFSVPANQTYTIMVFADYIPADFTPNADGIYPDYFYNTSASLNSRLRTTPGSDSGEVSASFFNNDYYDAFFAIEKINKGESEYILDMTLTRATAKVIFRDNSGNEGRASVSVNKVGPRKQIDFLFEPVTSDPASDASSGFDDLKLESTPEINDSEKDVFFFYTLADSFNNSQKVFIEFSVDNGDVAGQTFSVSDIPVKANFQTIVSGSFLPAVSDDDPSVPLPPVTVPGDIIVNVSADTNWNQQPMTK